jgi:hypothetical protein
MFSPGSLANILQDMEGVETLFGLHAIMTACLCGVENPRQARVKA